MPENPEHTERQIWGASVKAMRIRNGLTLQEAASAYEPEGFTPGDPDKGLSVQRWQQIEKGGLRFTPEQRKRLAVALGGSLEELELERARILGHRRAPQRRTGMEEPEARGLVIPMYGRTELGRDGWTVNSAESVEGFFDLRELMGPSIGITQVADDGMGDKAAPGSAVIFDRSKRPQLGKGCVVETNDGQLVTRFFEGVDGDHVMLRSAGGKPIAMKRELVKGVYAVRFWGD